MSSTVGLPSGAFDAVVSSLVLCSVGDVAESATDLYRWLKPGGTLLFMEHMAHGQQIKARRLCDECASKATDFFWGCEISHCLLQPSGAVLFVVHMADGQQRITKGLSDKGATTLLHCHAVIRMCLRVAGLACHRNSLAAHHHSCERLPLKRTASAAFSMHRQ